MMRSDGKVAAEIPYRADAGTTFFYFGLPAESISAIMVVAEDGDPSSVQVHSLEIRSDQNH